MSEFDTDNEWQERMRRSILVPAFYGRRFKGEYELIPHTDPRAAGGCDTIVRNHRVDEKIVRWPERDTPYTAFALEVMSCTVPGHERDGWMKTNTVDTLLYCFADKSEISLICYRIPFRPLQDWFYSQDQDLWPLWTSKQINRTQCRIVDISEVEGAVANVRSFTLWMPAGYDREGHFVHYCHCGKWGSSGANMFRQRGQIGVWYCAEHNPVAAQAAPGAAG